MGGLRLSDQGEFVPTVVVTMPRYGPHVHPAAMRSLYQATKGDCRVVSHLDVSQSICYAFNIANANALDWRDQGLAAPDGTKVHPTHLAMIHADIEAPPGWLDTLWHIMRERDLVAISSVSPIKDPVANPRTSTAFATKGETWFPCRYVYVNDRHTMPETFEPADVCKPGEELLINTGLMLLDLRWPGWDGFNWQLDSRIVKADGKRVVQMRSEDWMMSRHLAQHGAKYAATWAVPLRHFGEYAWASHVEPPAA
jgi:hypothetical protein